RYGCRYAVRGGSFTAVLRPGACDDEDYRKIYDDFRCDFLLRLPAVHADCNWTAWRSIRQSQYRRKRVILNRFRRESIRAFPLLFMEEKGRDSILSGQNPFLLLPIIMTICGIFCAQSRKYPAPSPR